MTMNYYAPDPTQLSNLTRVRSLYYLSVGNQALTMRPSMSYIPPLILRDNKMFSNAFFGT